MDPVKKKEYNDRYQHKHKNAINTLNEIKSLLNVAHVDSAIIQDKLNEKDDIIRKLRNECNDLQQKTSILDDQLKLIDNMRQLISNLNLQISQLENRNKSINDLNEKLDLYMGAFYFIKVLEKMHPNSFNSVLSKLKRDRERMTLDPISLDKLIAASQLLPVNTYLSPPPIIRS